LIWVKKHEIFAQIFGLIKKVCIFDLSITTTGWPPERKPGTATVNGDQKMTTISAQQARNTRIFVINNYKMEVEETTMYDHVRESAEETTSPRGVMPKLFVEEVDNGEAIVYELRQWQPNGRARTVDTFDTEEQAQDEWYTRTYNYDFMTDDQRDTMYWLSFEEAEKELENRHNAFNCGFEPNED
jgi:hypothetical protein